MSSIHCMYIDENSIHGLREGASDEWYRRWCRLGDLELLTMWGRFSRFRAASCLNALPVVPEPPGLVPCDLWIFGASFPDISRNMWYMFSVLKLARGDKSLTK